MSLHPAGRLDLDNAQLQRVLTAVPFGVVMYEGPEHRAVFSNAAHDEMTGGRIRLGVPLLQSLPELAGQPVMTTLDAVYATGQTFWAHQIAAQLRRGGRLENCWFRVTWQPVTSGTGQTIGVIVSSIEVTPFVLSQQQLDASQAEAARLAGVANDNERHLRELVEALPDLVWSSFSRAR